MMKKLRRLLPGLLIVLVLLVLFSQMADRSDTGQPTALTQESAALSEELLELSPEPDSTGGTEQTAPPPAGTDDGSAEEPPAPEETAEPDVLPEDGSYTTKEDVALYLVTYGHLPGNFVTKAEAEKAGWKGGSLEDVLPGKCIGGDRFGNREGLLPKAKGRTWTECDINTLGKKSRGPERLVFSNDGLIYYTADHYESFTKLYG